MNYICPNSLQQNPIPFPFSVAPPIFISFLRPMAKPTPQTTANHKFSVQFPAKWQLRLANYTSLLKWKPFSTMVSSQTFSIIQNTPHSQTTSPSSPTNPIPFPFSVFQNAFEVTHSNHRYKSAKPLLCRPKPKPIQTSPHIEPKPHMEPNLACQNWLIIFLLFSSI